MERSLIELEFRRIEEKEKKIAGSSQNGNQESNATKFRQAR